MGLDEKMTVTQIVQNATKTIDGISTYFIVAVACAVFLFVVICKYLLPDILNVQHGNRMLELSVFAVLTTPLMYLGLAYFSACGRASEIINAAVMISVNGYLVFQYFF